MHLKWSLLHFSSSRTSFQPAAVQKSRVLCTWRRWVASRGRKFTCSCVAQDYTVQPKGPRRWQQVHLSLFQIIILLLMVLWVSVCQWTLRLRLPCMFWLINYFCLQEPRHLQLLADLEDSNIFTVTTGKKHHGAPTDYEFCIKVGLRKHTRVEKL